VGAGSGRDGVWWWVVLAVLVVLAITVALTAVVLAIVVAASGKPVRSTLDWDVVSAVAAAATVFVGAVAAASFAVSAYQVNLQRRDAEERGREASRQQRVREAPYVRCDLVIASGNARGRVTREPVRAMDIDTLGEAAAPLADPRTNSLPVETPAAPFAETMELVRSLLPSEGIDSELAVRLESQAPGYGATAYSLRVGFTIDVPIDEAGTLRSFPFRLSLPYAERGRPVYIVVLRFASGTAQLRARIESLEYADLMGQRWYDAHGTFEIRIADGRQPIARRGARRYNFEEGKSRE
jgi:hypothetical protein